MQKIALITGGGRGIGAAIAEKLGKAGFVTWVNYSKSAEAAEAVCARIREAQRQTPIPSAGSVSGVSPIGFRPVTPNALFGSKGFVSSEKLTAM